MLVPGLRFAQFNLVSLHFMCVVCMSLSARVCASKSFCCCCGLLLLCLWLSQVEGCDHTGSC